MYETSKYNPNDIWEKHWDEHWNKNFNNSYFSYKKDLNEIKQTLNSMKIFIKLIENDINNMEDKNDAIS